MADNVKVRVDLREVTRALQEYEKHSSRDLATLVKGAAIDVAFKANQAAPKASKGDIPPMQSGLFYALASADPKKQAGAFGKAAEAAQRRIGGRVVKGSNQLKSAAKTIRNQRTSAASYTKALFLKMASQLGAKVRAAKSAITNASARERKDRIRPTVTLRIEGVEASHARDILEPAMQAGINAVAAKYWKKVADKLAKTARAHSGRKK